MTGAAPSVRSVSAPQRTEYKTPPPSGIRSVPRRYSPPLWIDLQPWGRDRLSCEFPGTGRLTVRVATALADADGVELISSDQPVVLDESMVALIVTVEGAFDAVADAVAGIRGGMPTGASIEIAGG